MMMTRCPTCSTAFRVTPEQLKLRAGKVRCGHCGGVFNALATLEDSPSAAETIEITTPLPELLPEPLPEPPPSPAAVAPPPASAPEIVPAAPPSGETAAMAALAASDGLLSEEAVELAPPVPVWRKLAWGSASLAAFGLMLAQAAYLFRVELAASQPGLRPLLETMCGMMECKIPLPRKADLVSIEASGLSPDPQRKLLQLTATLKNLAPFAQDYPHLELTLTDTRDQPIVRKVFAPAEYLPEEIEPGAGFATNGDLAVNLWLDVGDTAASGYRIYVFYP